MMKRLFRSLILAGALSILTLPAFVRAQSPEARTANLCSRLLEHRQSVETSVNQRLAAFREVAQEQAGAVARQQTVADETLMQTHQKYDSHFRHWFDERRQSASEQELARLEDFQSEVARLVSQQRQDLAAARERFRLAVQQLMNQRQAAVEQKAADFQSRIAQAFDDTQQSCRRDRADRQAFVQELRAARLSYAEFRRDQASFSEELQHAQSERRDAVQAIRRAYEQDFQKILDTYQAE